MSIYTSAVRADGEYGQFLSAFLSQLQPYRDPRPILVTGLCGGAGDAFLAAAAEDLLAAGKRPLLVLCPDEKECERTAAALVAFGIAAAHFVPRDLNLYDISASHEFEHERLSVLCALRSGKLSVVTATPDAALGYTVPPETLDTAAPLIDMDSAVEPERLAASLVAAGYARVPMVESAGQFSLRGGIIDIFPPCGIFHDGDGTEYTGAMALRIELWDDTVDRMGLFDPDTQRVTYTVTDARLLPAREVIASPEALCKLRDALHLQKRRTHNPDAVPTLEKQLGDVQAALSDGGEVRFLDRYLTLVYPEKACLLDYFRTDGRSSVFFRGYTAVCDRLKASTWHLHQTAEELAASGTVDPAYLEYAKPESAVGGLLDTAAVAVLDSMARGLSDRPMGGVFGFRTRHTVSYAEKYDLLTEDLRTLTGTGYRVCLTATAESEAKNLAGLLGDKGVPAKVADPGGDTFFADGKDTVTVTWGNPVAGFDMIFPKAAMLSMYPDAATFRQRQRKSGTKKKKDAARAILSFADLHVGDYVVHENYGIGQYLGIQNIATDGVKHDYIAIRYAGAEKLYIPVEKLDMVSKYIGSHEDDGSVKLSHFGSDTWGKTKSRVRAAVKDLAKDLIKLYAERHRRPGYAFPPDDDFQRDFEAAFEYEETESQLTATEEIKEDMMKPSPMDRLLCGDVGFGKTEVALRAAYKAVLAGKQVAILVPTTLLAMQHFGTASARMRSFAVNVDTVSRFRTPKQQARTLAALERGEVDLIVGTHRLLSSDVKFKNLGLLIIDEEQRFGVAQKEKLKQLASGVDVLSLSATPIPRTLNMAMGGICDISVLDEAPEDRQPVQTYVLEHDEAVILDAVRRELHRGGQVFYLYNRVDSISTRAAKLKEQLPDARIAVAHGQMAQEDLEDIWEQMARGEIDVLVCTTIIETGVDIPNANTLVIEGAQNMGLAQLHQIRGRVGRSARRAYAYLTYPPFKSLTDIARKRLEAIREYAEFGAGFRIALRDMEIRGAGNLLGAEQHGHMESVGYDLYIKLLKEAVLEEQGTTTAVPLSECKVTLPVDAFLPDSYVAEASERMCLYKRIALIRTEEDRSDVEDELCDRYGDVPRPARNLLSIALLRALAEKAGMKSVYADNGNLVLVPLRIEPDAWLDTAEGTHGKLRIQTGDIPRVVYRPDKGEDALRSVIKLLHKYLTAVTAEIV